MNTRHILLCLALSLLEAGLQAQTDLPQVFSPNAAELGKYGKIPVSYFNGLPNISIPLTELRAKGYTLPIYLTYHAGGNKPDQHPGWVGLGWTLHAGGCINRIVNGFKDEMSYLEAEELHEYDPNPSPGGIGYLYHSSETQCTDWASGQTLEEYASKISPKDHAPDEFQVCLDGLNASFYITGDNHVQIVSQSDNADFEVAWTLQNAQSSIRYNIIPAVAGVHEPLTAIRYTCFSGFTITDKQGIKYKFGGTDTAIEYETNLYGNDLVSSANTWLLSEIETPDGERISFQYVKDGTPLVRSDVRTKWNYTEYGDFASFPYEYDTDISVGEGVRGNISFSLIQPSYLSSINCMKSGDEILFSKNNSVEAVYPYTETEMGKRFVDFNATINMPFNIFRNHDHYCQLSQITHQEEEILFEYSSNTSIRLHLNSVSFKGKANADTSSKYTFTYNESVLFPGYNSKTTDCWGYYNGKDYGSKSYAELASFRSPDPDKMKLEILTMVYYPTGGYTQFEYEPHSYSKIMSQFPVLLRDIQSPTDSIAGGLRISRMTDVPLDGPPVIRRFFYDNQDGRSSGILSGIPAYHSNGIGTGTWIFPPNDSFWGLQIGCIPVRGTYILDSERYLSTLSTTNGNHVVYSRVVEKVEDGGMTEYCYSNHTEEFARDRIPMIRENFAGMLLTSPLMSRQLFRGLLLSKSVYDKNNALKQKEEYQYHVDTTQSIKSVSLTEACSGWLRRVSFSKVYTGHPYLEQEIIRQYPDGDGIPYKERVIYTYDSHRRLTEVRRNVAGAKERDTYTYTGNYTDTLYSDMNACNMIARPVEHIHFRKDTLASEKAVSADLVTWKNESGYYVPAGQWKADLGQGVLSDSFNAFNGEAKDSRYGSLPELSFTRYDADGNLVLSEDRSGLPTTYFWTPDGCHPAAIFKGARNATREQSLTVDIDGSVWSDLNGLSSGGSIDLVFNNSRTGNVNVFLDFLRAYGRTVWWRIDFGLEHRWDWPNLGPYEVLEVQALFSGVLTAGRHVFQITAVQGNYNVIGVFPEEEQEQENGGEGSGNGPMATDHLLPLRVVQTPLPSWGFITVTYPSTMNQSNEVRADECLFESFGPDATGSQDGFDGGGTFTGVKTLDFSPYPDKTYVIDWQELQPDGTWAYRSKTVPGTGTFTAGTAGKVMDHVRVFPQGTQVESYSWDSAGNLLSRTDSRGVTESYLYDGLGRLTGVYDNEGNKVEGYQYNYKNR